MQMDQYDSIVTGAVSGGKELAQRLAHSGQRILMIKRGYYLSPSHENWDSKTVLVEAACQANNTGYSKRLHLSLHYFFGGNLKVYGAALAHLHECHLTNQSSR